MRQSFAKSVQVVQVSTISAAGVTPGSTMDDPAAKGMKSWTLSVPMNRRLAWACAPQNADGTRRVLRMVGCQVAAPLLAGQVGDGALARARPTR